MLGLSESDVMDDFFYDALNHLFFTDADAAVSRSPLGIPNVDCRAMMQSCMKRTPRRRGGVHGSSRCQACADSCRALGNLWPRNIPGTRMQCPQYL